MQRNKLALQKSEERFRLVVESAPNAIVMIGPTGLIEMVNAQTERVFGYTRVELLGKPIEVLVPERYRANHPGLRKSFFADPVSRPMGAGRDLYGLRKDGSEFPVEIGLNPIETDEGTMVLSAIVDISARKQLEERFRLVVKSAPNAIVMIGPTGLIEMVNAQTERVFGYTRVELLGKPIEVLVPERYRANHPGLRKSFFADPVSRPMGAGRDLYGLRKDGSEFPVEIGLNPIETDEGTMVLSAIVDISARKQLEERFRLVVESAPNAIVMIGPTGLIEMVNAQTERVFGYTRVELLGKPIEVLVPERYRANHPGLRKSFFADPVSRPMGAGRDLYGLRKDGSEFPVEIGLNPIETDEGTMVLSAIVDISARKRLEERFRLVVELAPNAIVMIGPTGLIEMVNAQTERVFGYTRVELLGKPIEVLVPERYRANHPGLRKSFFADPVSRPMGAGRDLYGLRKDGSEFPVEIGLNPIETDEGTMVLSAIVDISARKQLEERINAVNEQLTHMNRVATVGELSSSIAHELKQPLAAIVVNANAGLRWLANERPDLDESRAALSAIVSAGHRAGEIIESLRSMFKKGSQEKIPVQIDDVIQNVLALTRVELERKGIVIQTELTRPLPLVIGHDGQLQQVISNLVRNAVEAMNSVSPHARVLRVKTAFHDSEGVLVSIEELRNGH